MKKILYTACGKSVFGSGSGFQIYTLSKSFSAEERKAAVAYVNSYAFCENSEQPVRNVYAYDATLGYVYAQTKPAGVDYSSGRGGNFIGQAIIQTGNNPLLPISVFAIKDLFRQPLTKDEATGARPTDYLPDYEPLPALPVSYGRLDNVFAQKQTREVLCSLIDAVIASLSGGKQVLICDTTERAQSWLYAATACLPLSIARLVTFDTYAHNPQFSSERVVCALPTGTAYAPSQYRNSEQFALFDFANKIFTHKCGNGFYYKYLQSMSSTEQLKRLHATCERELASVQGNVDVARFLDGVAYLDYFLNCDARSAFASSDSEAANRRKQIVTTGKFLEQYHSAALIDEACNRVKELVGISGRWSTALELRPILFAQSLPTTEKASALYREFLASVLQEDGLKPNGLRPFYEFAHELHQCGMDGVVDFVLKLLVSRKQDVLAANFEDFKEYLQLLLASDDATFQQGIILVADYLQNHAQTQVFADVAAILLEANELRRHLQVLTSRYAALFDAVCNGNSLSQDFWVELKRECQILDKANGNSQFVSRLMDKAIAFALQPTVPATQVQRVELLLQLFSGVNDVKLAVSIVESGIADAAKQPVMLIYLNYCYQLSKQQGLCNVFKQLSRLGTDKVEALFGIAIKNGDGINACVELARANVGNVANGEQFQVLFTRLLLGDWYNYTESNPNAKNFAKTAKSGFHDFLKACDACTEQEKVTVVPYFARLIFEAAVTRPLMLVAESDVCAFVSRYEKYLQADKELHAKFWLIRLLVAENKPVSAQSALESKNCNFKIEQWQDGRVAALCDKLIEMQDVSLTEISIALLQQKFGLDMSRNLDYYFKQSAKVGLATVYVQIANFGEEKVRKLFDYALEQGNRVCACVELVRVGVNRLAEKHGTQPIFDKLIDDEKGIQPIVAAALLGEWVNAADSKSSMKSFPKYTKVSFNDFNATVKTYSEAEKVNVVQYFAELIFENGIVCPALFLQDNNVWGFVDRYKKYLAANDELYAKYCLVRLFTTEKKAEKIQKRLEKECDFELKQWADKKAVQFLFDLIVAREITFTEESVTFVRENLALDVSQFEMQKKK